MDVDYYNNDFEEDKRLQTELRKLGKEYKVYLEKKGHKVGYIENQLDLIYFFGNHYLIGNTGQSILEVDENDIYEFLGSWCIRKVMYHNKASILPYLRAFKKFFNFLLHLRKISKDQYDDLIKECNNPRKYVEKYERFENLDHDSDNWVDEFEGWLFDHNQESKKDLYKDLTHFTDLEIEFLRSLPEYALNEISIVEDFILFGNYISAQDRGIVLTLNLFCLKKKDIIKVNSLMRVPETLSKNTFQKDTILIHFFFLVGKRLGLFKYTRKMSLSTTPLFTKYLELSLKEQYYVLFRGLWNKISWFRLNSYSDAGRPEWIYRDRNLYPPFFSSLNVDEYIPYKEFRILFGEFYSIDNFNPFAGGWRFVIGIFPEKILPLFEYFGLIKLNFKNIKEIYNIKELKIKITLLGHLFFSGITKFSHLEEEDNNGKILRD